jgi:hypothetical protein
MLVREAFVGFEYPTEHLEYDAGRQHCRCGTIDHGDELEELRSVEGGVVLTNLFRCLFHLHASGAIDESPDLPRLFDGFRESGGDLDYAVGQALYGDT